MAAKNELQMDKGRYEYFLEKYKGKIRPEILKQYKDPDQWVVINEDKNLHPVHIPLPEPPEWHTIDGWGLPANEQKFQYPDIPKKLKKLIESCERQEQIWDQLENRQAEFKQEIEWIREQWKRYENGYWFFCNGKPTHITGWHYIYLGFWRFKSGGRPEYRDRNRKFQHAMYYAYTTKQTVAYEYKEEDSEKKNPRPIYEDIETRRLKMVETNFRTMYGIIYPKPRKDGASNQCECAKYMETSTHKGVVGGTISMTGEHAETKLFQEIMVPGWNQMPFFLKPRSTSNRNPGAEIVFNASRSRSDKLNIEELGSTLNYSGTSTASMYDGGNNIWINRDEGGKTINTNVYIDHSQLKPCVALGGGSEIFGFLTYPSTVGEMEGDGGRNFYNICRESQFQYRNIAGQTQSGLMVIYMPSYEGLHGFIGPYGESIIDTPTPEQAEYIGRDIGAKEYLLSQRAAKLSAGNMDGYNEEVRLFPITYMECFRTEDGEIGFNTKKINDRIDEWDIECRDLVRIGNFVTEDGDPDSNVVWRDDPKGRWELSKLLNEDQTNRIYRRTIEGKTVRFPHDPKFTASADPFKFNETRGNRMSDGGGGVFWDYDPSIDGAGKDINHWQSNRFVCVYLERPPTKKEYAEDMLLMCRYFGAKMNPEIDVDIIWTHFEERGYGGFLFYETDIKTGKPHNTPGFNSRGSRQRIFNAQRDHIELHVHREVHLPLLRQWKDIGDMAELTDYDLVTVAGGCLIATPGIKNIPKEIKTEDKKITKLYPKRSYSKYVS